MTHLSAQPSLTRLNVTFDWTGKEALMPQLMVRVTTKKLGEKLLKCENEVDNSIYSNVLRSKKGIEEKPRIEKFSFYTADRGPLLMGS